MHRAELLRQWQERLQAFLDVAPEAIGCIGGGKAKLTGQFDIAVMQSLVRKGEVNSVVQGYGQMIVDECHHITAASFETIFRQVRVRHVLGLSATLVRRDSLQPILFMQCGAIRHTAQRPAPVPGTGEPHPSAPSTTRRSADQGADAQAGGGSAPLTGGVHNWRNLLTGFLTALSIRGLLGASLIGPDRRHGSTESEH